MPASNLDVTAVVLKVKLQNSGVDTVTHPLVATLYTSGGNPDSGTALGSYQTTVRERLCLQHN